METKTNENEVTVNKEERFYVLKIHEHMTKNPPILVATIATNYEKARRNFQLMRPKMPVLDPKKFTVIDMFNISNEKEFDRLMTMHGNFGEIHFFIKRTDIDTYVPIEFHKKIIDLEFVKNKVCIYTFIDKKEMKNIKEFTEDIESTIQKNLLTLNTEHVFYVNEKQGDESIKVMLNAGNDLAFVITDRSITQVIKFAKHVYEIVKQCENTDSNITFMYCIPDEKELFYIDMDKEFSLRRVEM